MAINLPIVSKYDNKGVQQAEGALGKLSGSVKKFGGILAAAFSVAAVGSFVKDALLGAEAAQVATDRLNQVAKSMGIFGDETEAVSKRLSDFAEANEMVLAVDADVIKSTQAKLLTFKELANTADDAGGSFDRATKAALDLAATGFGTAEGNAVALGKALNDPIKGITSLTRSGITFTAAEKDKIKVLTESGQILEAQNMILAAIEMQVGGTAEATAKASEKMKLGFMAIQDEVGFRLLPVFEKFADVFVEQVVPAVGEAFIQFDKLTEKISNVFKGAGGGVEGLMAILGSFATTITDWINGGGLQTILAKFIEFRTAIINALVQSLPPIILQITSALIAALPAIADTLLKMIPVILETAILVFKALIEAVTIIIPQLVVAIAEALPEIATAIMEMLPGIITSALELFKGLVEGLLQAIPLLLGAILDSLPVILQTLVEMLPGLVKGAIDLFLGLVEALITVIPALINTFTNVVLPKLIKTLVDLMPVLVPAAIQLFFALVQGLVKATPIILKAVVTLIPTIVGGLLSGVGQLIAAGFQLLMGLVKGLVENAPAVIGRAVRDLANLVTDEFKKLLGIKSPSKVFQGFGKNIAQGLVGGLNGSENIVKNAVDDLASIAIGAGGTIALGLPAVAEAGSMAAGATGFSESSGISILPSSGATNATNNTYNVNVNAGMGTDGTNVGRQIVDEILRFERASGRVFVRA
jgi:hypothetical protein